MKHLGDDAVILSNRTVNGGNEIMAFSEAEMDAIATGHDSDDTEVTLNALMLVEDSRSSTLEELLKKRMQSEKPSIASEI